MHRHGAFGALIGLGLAAGAGMMLGRMMAFHRYAYEREAGAGTPGNGEPRYGFKHVAWRRGYPPVFEEWHRRAHADEKAEAKPADEAKPAAAESQPAAEPAQA